MKKSTQQRGQKLIYYFQRLSPKEKKQFRQYLESPLLGNSIQAVHILGVLEENEKSGELSALEPEWFHTFMIPDEPMGPQKLHYIWVRLSVFQEKLEQFLSFIQFREDPAIHRRYLLEICKNKGWEKYLGSIYSRSIKKLPAQSGSQQYRDRLELEILLNDYLSDHAVGSTDTHLGMVQENLDAYFVVQKLKYACAAENARWIWGKEFAVEFLEPGTGIYQSGYFR